VAIGFLDRVTAFLAGGTSRTAATGGSGRSLSLERSQQGWMSGYGGIVGKRIANSDAILAKHGSGDLSLWADIHDDERAFSCFQQRRLAVTKRDWIVEPGASDRKSKKAAQHLSDQLKTIGRGVVADGVEVIRVGGWDQVTNKMLYGIWYGYAVAEMIWGVGADGLIRIQRIDVPDRGWFGFDASNRLRITDAMGVRDEEVPPRKFWSFTSGADHDFAPYGVGLAHWLFWPVFFKRQGLPFWLTFLEKFGSPTVVGKTGEGQLDSAEGRSRVLETLRSIISFGVTAIPSWLEIELLSAANAGEAGYEKLIDRCDGMITRVILSQTMTTDDGSSRSQAEVHMDVRDEVVKADADLLCESFNQGPAVWLTEWNFPGATPPRVYRVMDEPEDLQAVAERDTTLKALGWERTEDSFREVYGEGFERREQAPTMALMPGQQPGQTLEQFAASDPQPLYVSRKLLNGVEFLSWAESQGFTATLPASDLHVTVLYSKRPVNWFKMGSDYRAKVTVEEGGPRKVDALGDKGAVVLHFSSSDLEWRHDEMVQRGASHDFADYQCHVTITYDGTGVDMDKVEPYRGKLVFGPEIFEPIEEDWQPKGPSFAAEDLDAIDRLVTAMAEGGNEALMQFVAPLKDKLAGVSNPEIARIALLDHLETMDPQQFAEVLGKGMLAVRGAAEAGVDVERVGG
jgi:phage gp29-like protein